MPRDPVTVLVTGAEGGLGSVVCHRLLQHGMRVIGTARRRLAAAPPEGMRWVAVDVADARSVQAQVGAIAEEIDALVHCAGGFRHGPLEDLSDADLDFLINVNLRSSLLLVRALLPAMKQRNHGRMVLVSAQTTLTPGVGVAAYVATKAGINALVQSVAREVRAHDITINAVLPGMLDTPANRRDMPGADFSTWVSPLELADTIHVLLTPPGRLVNGALLPVPARG